MLVTQKHQYALRAVYELARRKEKGPVKISEIAEAQAIPVRFPQVILNQLKSSGIVESKRGLYGGYFLTRPSDQITAGDIFRFIEGSTTPVECIACISKMNCPFGKNCAFFPMWEKVQTAIYDIYDRTSIQDLLDKKC